MPERYPYAMRKAAEYYVELLLQGIGAAGRERAAKRAPAAKKSRPARKDHS
jgi:hypothetical protein